MTDTPKETPREFAERLFRDLPRGDASAFADRMADDGVFEIPFSLPGMPVRLVGPDEVRAHLARRWANVGELEIHGTYQVIHETSDPEVVIVENDVDFTVKGERSRARTSINVIRVRDGKMLLFRDYMNTARSAAVLGPR